MEVGLFLTVGGTLRAVLACESFGGCTVVGRHDFMKWYEITIVRYYVLRGGLLICGQLTSMLLSKNEV
jgi:hypothetical protein